MGLRERVHCTESKLCLVVLIVFIQFWTTSACGFAQHKRDQSQCGRKQIENWRFHFRFDTNRSEPGKCHTCCCTVFICSVHFSDRCLSASPLVYLFESFKWITAWAVIFVLPLFLSIDRWNYNKLRRSNYTNAPVHTNEWNRNKRGQ